MNLTGVRNYSKETVGLRQPDKILDQQFKLIYVYPMLFSDQVISYQDSIRRFLTVSFLQEILVSNSLNIVSMASQINTAQNQQSAVAQLIGNAFLSAGGNATTTNTTVPTTMTSDRSYELQNKVYEKLNIIKRYMDTDVRTKKLLPYIEMITLNNMVTVPVIVGTKPYSTTSLTLLYIIAIAMMTNTPLNKIENIQKIVTLLKNTKEELWYTLLARFAEKNKSFREELVSDIKERYPQLQLNGITAALIRGLEGKSKMTWFGSNDNIANRALQSVGRRAGLYSDADKQQEQRDLAAPEIDQQYKNENNAIFNTLKLAKDNLDDTLLQFKFLLNTALLKSQTGIDISNSTMEATVSRISPSQQQIFAQLLDKFIELISTYGSPFLSSTLNTLYPHIIDPVTNNVAESVSINFLELKSIHFDSGLNTKMQSLIYDTFSKEVSNSLGGLSPTESKTKIDLLKSLCQSKDQVDSIIETELKSFNGREIPTVNFSQYQFELFTGSLQSIAGKFGSMNKRFENTFSQLVNNGNNLLSIARQHIYSSIEDYIRAITNRPNYMSNMQYILGVPNDRVQRIYIPQITDTLFVVFYFFFLYRLQSAVCQLVDIIDVEVETATTDVLSFPNYTLVLPIDIVLGVYTAYVAGRLNNALSGQNIQEMSSYNDNYIRGIVKVLNRKLMIPNIVIIDEKKQEIHYKFMYMSTLEKIKYQSLDSFVKNINNQ